MRSEKRELLASSSRLVERRVEAAYDRLHYRKRLD